MAECTPGTPGISEVRPEMGSESCDFCTDHYNPEVVGDGSTRKVALRAEIDTSPPFGSVKEAVTRFGGSGSWLPYYKFQDGYQALEDIDIKKVEEQASELEKDLIVKELETLDVLEELATTKKIVEELKRQLQNETLKCMQNLEINRNHKPSPALEGLMNNETCLAGLCPSPSPATSPNLILMELKQAKWNLGKTINDLGVIQTSVECLNKKMRKEKTFLAKTRQRLTSNFAGVLSLGEELKQARHKPSVDGNLGIEHRNDQIRDIAEAEIANDGIFRDKLRTAELRLVAAKKMEEAARAAEAVALAEIKALSSNKRTSGYVLPEPERVASFKPRSPLIPRAYDNLPDVVLKKKAENNISKMSILKKLKEAREEVKLSKQALEEALNKVEIANRKQLATEEALRKWMPEGEDQESHDIHYPRGITNIHFHHQTLHPQNSPLHEAMRVSNSNPVIEDPKPVLRSTTSMRDVLSKKQVLPEECTAARPTEGRGERQKVALSQMLHELREGLTFHPRSEKAGVGGEQKRYVTQRRKFGFIHIALPMTKTSKKKVQDFNNGNN